MIHGPIHLCFITDETYILPTATAIESLKVNKRAESRYVVHVICRDVPDEGVAKLESVASPDVQIDAITNARLPVNDSRVSLVRHVSPAAVFKFFIADILQELDRVIYIDDDVLIQGDLGELWDTDISGVYAGVVKDSQTVIGWEKHLKWLDFRHESYFNSGVMYLNLSLMRRDNLPSQLVDYRVRGKNRFMDQDALNVVFGDRVKYLSIRYNCLNWLFLSCTIEQLKGIFGEDDVADTPEANYDRAVILHIGGSEKPWLRDLPYYTKKYRPYAERIGWHFDYPRVSVVMPVYNAASHLRQCLDSILAQTLKSIDVVCVDNGSTDGSLEILEEYSALDSRVRVFNVSKKGAGRCRNFGISKARGFYVGFVDSDDFIDPDYFEKLYVRAMKDGSDVCMTSSVMECSAFGTPLKPKNMGAAGRTLIKKVKERGDLILASGVTWNKIYKNRFLCENGIHYDELPCAGEDKIFNFGVLFRANRISVIDDTTYYYRQTDSSESFRRKGRESFAIIGFYRGIKTLLDSETMSESAMATWRSVVKRVRDAEFRRFSNRMDPKLRGEFDGMCTEAFYDDGECVNRIDGLIVSLTSFPARMDTLHRTIKTLLGQSVRPEKLVLWLGEDKFPEKEACLPQQLLELVPYGLEIQWCKDIRSYTKLVPALQKYRDKCIVTADDDILYQRYWLEKLWQSHLEHPSDIIAHRMRRMEMRGREFLPYNEWPIVTKSVPTEPFLAMFTGVGGVLYPPKCFRKEIFNRRVFLKLAPRADDLWFWAMSVLSRRKCTQVYAYESRFFIVQDAQKVSLSSGNVENAENDAQFNAILKRYPRIMAIIRAEARKRSRAKFRAELAKLPYGIVKGLAFVFVPYGLAALWLAKKQNKPIDMPLFYYKGKMKTLRRLVKFCLPFGPVYMFRNAKYGKDYNPVTELPDRRS